MNRLIKTILIVSACLPLALAQAQVNNLVVQFEQTPLFNEANFLPGAGVARWVKVTNNSPEAQRIAAEAINISDPNNFASQLNLTIKESLTTIFNDTLEKFFDQGETYLSSLTTGTTTQYDFTITFNPSSGNEYQEKVLGFDILVGFEGTEGGLPLPPAGGGTGGGGSGGGGGGGGSLPQGLSIFNEAWASTTKNSVTMMWTTSYPATSQIIYALEGESHILDLTDSGGTPPKYGYSRTTPEYNAPAIPNGVVSHSVTITGLTPGTTYYYRTVSHASLAIGHERSFTTLASGDNLKEVSGTGNNIILAENNSAANKNSEISAGESGGVLNGSPGTVGQEGKGEGTIGEISAANKITARGLLATIGLVWDNISQSFLKSIVVLVLSVILLFVIFKKVKKIIHKRKEKI
ncbi:MAG: hypothetical protein Athens071426_469 [Parcubacteria group bacterium Athens0714_26]|nr:MAG: hypothetical protein Athens101426_674 [Parcubacteria group bacterium Athens1014_26]TSD02545.1 MAG: hypothetical protein Athens071426_469 [Parcubacteria group bacterium Athens0714_26]